MKGLMRRLRHLNNGDNYLLCGEEASAFELGLGSFDTS